MADWSIEMTASEALALYEDLPDGAAFAAAADLLGMEPDDFAEQLAYEHGEEDEA